MKLSVRVRLTAGHFELAAEFEAEEGITALFGPSGAGKTLTLRSIAGLTHPDEGRIVLADRVLFDSAAGIDLPARERGIGFVFQQYALFPHLDVERNIAFGIHGLPKEEQVERIASLLSLVGLEGFERRGVRDLSGGQQQRVALARALATRPSLLLLDEPFGALDLRVRRRLRGELRRIHELTGTPMLLVTHDVPEVRHLSDAVVLLEEGRVLLTGRTPSLLSEPLDPVFAELIDE